MGKIYKNQTALRIEAHTGINITGALDQRIYYKKPSGIINYWTATILNSTQGIIYYDVDSETDIDESGSWYFWAWVKFADGREAPGEPQEVTVYELPS